MTVTVAKPKTEQVDVTVYNLKKAIAKNRLIGLARIMDGYQLMYTGAIVGLAITAIARTATFLLISYFVDDVLGSDNLVQTVPLVALGFLALAAIQAVFSYLSGRWAAETAENVAWRLRNYLYDHLQRLSFTYHDRMQTGESITRCTSDVETIRHFFVEQGVGIGRILLLFIVNFVGILLLDVPLALFSIAVVPVLVIMSIFFFKKISRTYEAFQEQESRLSTILQEHLSGVRVVKAFARQDYEQNKFEKENHAKYQRGKELVTLHATYWPLTDLVVGAQLIAGFLVGAVMAINGTITVGNYLAYAGMVDLMVNPMRQIGRLIVQTATGMVSYDRIMEIVREEREFLGEGEPAPVAELRGEIVFKDVTFEYEAGTPVLKDISFRVEAGQTISLLGSTGSGKTSLVGLLPRFYDYTSGSITLDGHELREYPRAFLRENIGIVEQEPFLFSRTIRENITYSVGRDVSDEEVHRAASAAAIHDVIMGFPDGYASLVGERGMTLSGGQKQRVVLARTLLKNPRILILDDATSSVDTETEAFIRSALKELMVDRTSFVIAHRIQTVMHADLILVLDQGRIVQMGTHDELLREDGIYKDTYDVQSRIEAELETEIEKEIARV